MYSRVQCTKSNENRGENEFVTHRTLPYASVNIMTHCRRFVMSRPKYLFFVRDIVAFLFIITIYRVVRNSTADAAFLFVTWHKGGYTLVTLPRTVTPYRDSVDGIRDRVTYQKMVAG
jgi:hypothetical protein